MMKYGVVGAIALAVLVAAMWDGSKGKKKGQDVASGDIAAGGSGETAVSGEVGAGSRASFAPEQASKPEEDVLEKYQVKKGDTLKGIAKAWLGDERLAESLYEANKARIPDVRHLNAHLTLVFPKSKFPKKTNEVGTAGSSGQAATVPAGMKKDEIKPTTEPAGDKKYVVKEGDTLYGIAKRELGKGSRWEEIVSLNHLDGNMVKKGQTLVLPAK